MDKGDTYNAIRWFEAAHRAIQHLRGEAPRQETKRRISQENVNLYAQLVACCLHENDTTSAFEYTAAGKGRAFVDTLDSTRFDLLVAVADDPTLAQDWQQARALRQQIDNIQMQLGGQSGAIADGEQNQRMLFDTLPRLKQQEKTLWEDLSYKYPALTATQQAPMLTTADAQALARELGATLVEYYYHAEGWCAFVVSPEQVQYVTLPAITEDLMDKMIDRLFKMDDPFCRTNPKLMDEYLHDWHAAVIAPLREHLPAGGRVMLAPHWVLNFFPIGAACDPQSGRYVCEDYLLAFAPSLSALWVMHQQAAKTQPSERGRNSLRVFSAAYAPDIPGLVPATRQTVQAFAPDLIEQYDRVTPDAIIAAVRQQPAPDVLHIAAHGWFDREMPEQSGLELQGGWLTVQRIIIEMPLQHTRLVTLASCLLGRASLEQSGEAVGITQAFLTAGRGRR
ncbi:MAG: CHAT domain-containing protein [Chloroflexaceae bacterium]|nr:CHAT domain-containing protein [Chloroflexaceae bacterium]